MTSEVPPPPIPSAQVPPPPTPHHIATAVPAHVPVQQDITLSAEDVQQETLEVDNSDAQHVADTTMSTHGAVNLEQTSDIPIQAATVNNTTLSQNSFSMQLNNVTYEIVRTEIINDEPILTPVRTLDVSSIAADPNANIDPTLQKEMDFMQTWLAKAAATEVPFSSCFPSLKRKN